MDIKETSKTGSKGMGQASEDMIESVVTQRKRFERRWYENNYFDDGLHFKLISKKTGRIIDTAGRENVVQERAIPRASRQIRGVSNLLKSADPYPVVYPEHLAKAQFQQEGGYEQAYEKAKHDAKRIGAWLTNEWEEEQELYIKLTEMILLAAKNGVSYLQVWADEREEKINTRVFDAFEIFLYGDRKEITQLPFIFKSIPHTFNEIKSNEEFDEKMVAKLSPDNRYATSEIKEAYMVRRFGTKSGAGTPTYNLNEGFIKEVLSDDNWNQAIKLGADTGALENKSRGDTIMRQVFTAGGLTLSDKYVDLDEYPIVDFRFEPGPIYQKALIENFIPQNKSLDIIVSRLEKWVNSMVVGIYARRKGENYKISNFPGGQFIDYEGSPPQQMPISNVGNTPFNVIKLLDKYIEEQGASTSALNQLPSGVKSGVAIESLKATEYANLKIPNEMLKKTIKGISERMIEIADKHFISPQTVYNLESNEPDYFDVIGSKGLDKRQEVDAETPEDIVQIKRGTRIRIEIEPGLGLTVQGKRESMQQIVDYMIKLGEMGYMTKEAIQKVIERFMEIFGYGSTQEFMESLDEGTTMEDMTEEQIQKMQIALAQVAKDLGMAGPEQEQKMVDSTKVGVAEAMKDLGMTQPQQKQPEQSKVSVNYKDLPPEGKAQAAAKAGIEITPRSAEIQQDETTKPKQIINSQK